MISAPRRWACSMARRVLPAPVGPVNTKALSKGGGSMVAAERLRIHEQFLLERVHPFELLIAYAALQLINAGRLQRLAGQQAASFLLVAAAAKPGWQTIAATKAIGLQLADDAIGPARRNLVGRQVLAPLVVTVDRVRRHRHEEAQSVGYGIGSPWMRAMAFMA